MHKASAAALALALVVFSNPLFLSRGAAAEAQVLKIGVQLPMTGERASVGRLMLNGLQMALDAVNSRNESLKLELVLADDESTPDGAVKALDKFVHDPQIVAIAGEINSPFVMASAPIVDKAGVPYLTAGSSPKTTLQSPWIFRVGASDALLANFLVRYMVDELKVKSIAIMHDKTGIHNQRAELVASVLKDAGGVIPVARCHVDLGRPAIQKSVRSGHCESAAGDFGAR